MNVEDLPLWARILIGGGVSYDEDHPQAAGEPAESLVPHLCPLLTANRVLRKRRSSHQHLPFPACAAAQ